MILIAFILGCAFFIGGWATYDLPMIVVGLGFFACVCLFESDDEIEIDHGGDNPDERLLDDLLHAGDDIRIPEEHWPREIERLKNLYAKNKISIKQFEDALEDLMSIGKSTSKKGDADD
jgi:hypothetical protein